MVKLAFLLLLIVAWVGTAGAVLCPNGQFVNGTNPEVCSTPVPCAYSQIGSGNGTFGQNTPYATNTFIMQEIFPVGGKVIHLSCKNITGGTCGGGGGNAPSFNVYVFHAGSQNNGTAVLCSTTQQAGANNVTSQVENMTFAAGDEVGAFVSNGASGCNAPEFDVDILVGVGSGC